MMHPLTLNLMVGVIVAFTVREALKYLFIDHILKSGDSHGEDQKYLQRFKHQKNRNVTMVPLV